MWKVDTEFCICCHTFITVNASPADVTLAGPVSVQSLVTESVLTPTVCRGNQRQVMDTVLLKIYFNQLHEPWSQWTPYFPLWQDSQAVPWKSLLHWQTPVPLTPSKHRPLPKQACPFGPGQGSHCSPKNPSQHLRSWKYTGNVIQDFLRFFMLGRWKQRDVQCSSRGRLLCSRWSYEILLRWRVYTGSSSSSLISADIQNHSSGNSLPSSLWHLLDVLQMILQKII